MKNYSPLNTTDGISLLVGCIYISLVVAYQMRDQIFNLINKNSVDQPGSCQRALCECDLQLVKDLVSESNTWSKKNHQFYGFDLDDGCKADSAGMAGRSSILFFQNIFYKSY